MGDGLFVHGGVTDAKEARLALAGLLALQGPGALDVRTGVLAGPGTTALVTGTTATAPMQVAIGVHDAVLTRGVANGPYVMPTEAVQLVTIAAAPASGTRVDVVWERQKDATAGVPTPDGAYGAEYGVLAGTVGAGKPDLATLGPVGALELATVAVSAGAVRTTDGTVLITNTARQTTTRGGIIPVRDQADRDSITAYPAVVHRLDTGAIERHGLTGSWVTVSDPAFSVTSAPRGRVASAPFTTPGPQNVVAETVFDTVTFTAAAGRRYRVTWSGGWINGGPLVTAVFRVRWAPGSGVSSATILAGTQVYGRRIRSWEAGAFLEADITTQDLTGLPAGQVTVGITVTGEVGATVSIPGDADNTRSILVEDIGV